MRSTSGHPALPLLRLCSAGVVLLSVFLSHAQAQSSSKKPSPGDSYSSVASRVLVPDVRGLRPEDAQRKLNEAGLQQGNVLTASGPGTVGTVWQQKPPQNSVVRRGTTVSLWVVASDLGTTLGNEIRRLFRQVPDLTGRTQNEASSLLERAGLQLGSVSQGNGSGAEGTVYDQDPQAKSWVRVGSQVSVNVVQAQVVQPPPTRWVIVPDLSGQTEQSAAVILKEQGLVLGRVVHGRVSGQPDKVSRQKPPADTKVPPGTQVSILIAQPPPESPQPPPLVTVPDLAQQSPESAGQLLAERDLRLGNVTNQPSNSPAGSIIDQQPDAGTQVEHGTSVDVVTAQEIAKVTVPDIVKLDEAKAITVLEGAGLHLGTLSEEQNDAATGTVLSQKPDAGEQVEPGTAVDAVISHEIVRQLTVMLDQADPRVGKVLGFHASLDPLRKGAKYKFSFGDGDESAEQWGPDAAHQYNRAGTFNVRAFAILDGETIPSEAVTVVIAPAYPWVIVVIGGAILLVLVLSGTAYSYRGRRQFRRHIRIAPHPSPGTQRVSLTSGGAANLAVRVRLAHDVTKSHVVPAGRNTEGR